MALSCWLALAISGLTMYAFARSLLSPWTSLAAAALFTWLRHCISSIFIKDQPYLSSGLSLGSRFCSLLEYRPKWWDGQLRKEQWQTAGLVESGDAQVRAIDDSGIEQSYSISAGTDSVITLRPLYFPGWIACVDGQKREIAPSPDGNIQLQLSAASTH
jgi:hypothetical protein